MGRKKLNEFSSEKFISGVEEKYRQDCPSSISNEQMNHIAKRVVECTVIPLGRDIPMPTFKILRFGCIAKSLLTRDYSAEERKEYFNQSLMELYFLHKADFDFIKRRFKKTSIDAPAEETKEAICDFSRSISKDVISLIVNTVMNSIPYADKIAFEKEVQKSRNESLSRL